MPKKLLTEIIQFVAPVRDQAEFHGLADIAGGYHRRFGNAVNVSIRKIVDAAARLFKECPE